MNIWSLLLRIMGLGLLTVSLPLALTTFSTFLGLTPGVRMERLPDLSFWLPIVEAAALALICFAVAYGIDQLRRLNERNDQQRAALRHLLNRLTAPVSYTPPPSPTHPHMRPAGRRESLAPEAPGDYSPVDPFPYNDAQKKVISRKQRMLFEALNDPEVQGLIRPQSKKPSARTRS